MPTLFTVTHEYSGNCSVSLFVMGTNPAYVAGCHPSAETSQGFSMGLSAAGATRTEAVAILARRVAAEVRKLSSQKSLPPSYQNRLRILKSFVA